MHRVLFSVLCMVFANLCFLLSNFEGIAFSGFNSVSLLICYGVSHGTFFEKMSFCILGDNFKEGAVGNSVEVHCCVVKGERMFSFF